jgi:hypothetical protein
MDYTDDGEANKYWFLSSSQARPNRCFPLLFIFTVLIVMCVCVLVHCSYSRLIQTLLVGSTCADGRAGYPNETEERYQVSKISEGTNKIILVTKEWTRFLKNDIRITDHRRKEKKESMIWPVQHISWQSKTNEKAVDVDSIMERMIWPVQNIS